MEEKDTHSRLRVVLAATSALAAQAYHSGTTHSHEWASFSDFFSLWFAAFLLQSLIAFIWLGAVRKAVSWVYSETTETSDISPDIASLYVATACGIAAVIYMVIWQMGAAK
jgi:hypothetical protein